MATRKAALIGCKEGPWVNTSRMRGLRVRVVDVAGLVLRVFQHTAEKDEVSQLIEGNGEHKLPEHPWTKIVVEEGPAESALCFLVANEA